MQYEGQHGNKQLNLNLPSNFTLRATSIVLDINFVISYHCSNSLDKFYRSKLKKPSKKNTS